MTTTPLPFEREDSGPYEGVLTITLEQPERPFVVLDKSFLRRLSSTHNFGYVDGTRRAVGALVKQCTDVGIGYG